ncbi:MAG: redoxin domain-containing protein [Pirellulaceae bacterium]|jgi:peroxiredoxin/tetratricopeptide (TPR) repeat protein|nr:redoxin domain-containing protein [Pirellulaceae bacterium]
MPRCLYLLTARNLLLLTSLLAVAFTNRLLAQDLAKKADVANQLGSEVAPETTDVAKSAGDDEESADGSTRDDIAAGHSFHGEAFNEGPRQAAYLMPGLGRVDFPVSTTNELAQRFINQGVAQLHGFWYYEAERSFRQAAVLDPDCAMCYWGMAQANVENRSRARDFIAQAVKRSEAATPRETRYIAAYEKFCRDEDAAGKKIDKQQRAKTFTRDLEELVEEFPDDVDARAFLALQLWQNERADLPIVSHVAVDSVLQDVFDANPMHPAHHYRIHLWDKHKPQRALESAALCGASLPAIAHMWHMPGHIYSGLHRYQDAVWQQEASARVDHAHMMRDRVLPDQIHNFAHNNEWLIRNLIKIGRVDDALALARNMQTLPRHPKLNTLDRSGSAKLGRERLLLTLSTYRLWPELIELAETNVIEPTDKKELQTERTRYLGIAYALSGQDAESAAALSTLETDLAISLAENEQLERSHERPPAPSKQPGDPQAEEEAAKQLSKQRDELKKQRQQLEKAIASVRAARSAAAEDWSTALKLWEDSDLSDVLLQAEWLASSGQLEEALKQVDKKIADDPNEVPSAAVKTWLLYQHSGCDSAREAFEFTRKLACVADLDTPLLARLQPVVTELNVSGDADALSDGAQGSRWTAAYETASDFGERPSLDSLGPFRWHPYLAPEFVVCTPEQTDVRLKHFAGRPTIVIFYLGFGCLHCVEQLHAFAPRTAEFRKAGIQLMAISSEDVESLNTGLASLGSESLQIPLHADPQLAAFKAYRCFDDFEQQPLHGTFLLGTRGRVLWQDIGYEPFMDVDFLLNESQRLLELQGLSATR